MSLILSLNEEGKNFIDNTNPAFEGTRYAGQRFKIFYSQLTRSQEFAIEKKYTKRGKKGPVTDEPAVHREKFQRTVTGWEDVCSINPHTNQSEPIECNDQSKALMCERAHKFTNLVMLAILNDETGLLDETNDYEEQEGTDEVSENF